MCRLAKQKSKLLGKFVKFISQARVILEKLINHKTVNHFSPAPKFTLGRGGGGVGVCEQSICYHVVAFMIPFNLICNMTMF